jgi:hypothetical protein
MVGKGMGLSGGVLTWRYVSAGADWISPWRCAPSLMGACAVGIGLPDEFCDVVAGGRCSPALGVGAR